MVRLATMIAVLLAGVTAAASANTFVDDFEGGVNRAGWAFIQGGDRLESTGGNPGWWLHQPTFDTFAPILHSAYGGDTPFTGNYRDRNVTRISFDARTLDMNFGDGSGYLIALVLRNSHGTEDVDDDDYAYYIGPNIPRVGEGWVHYGIDIPSQSGDDVPPGWLGGWAASCDSFRPGVTWGDVITHVDRVEIWWIELCNYAIFQTWNVGADNLTIEYENAVPAASMTWGAVKSLYRD